MRDKNILRLVGVSIGIAGFAFVMYSAGFLAGLGVFLAIWGNNIERRLE